MLVMSTALVPLGSIKILAELSSFAALLAFLAVNLALIIVGCRTFRGRRGSVNDRPGSGCLIVLRDIRLKMYSPRRPLPGGTPYDFMIGRQPSVIAFTIFRTRGITLLSKGYRFL
jgi:hypothetical protein